MATAMAVAERRAAAVLEDRLALVDPDDGPFGGDGSVGGEGGGEGGSGESGGKGGGEGGSGESGGKGGGDSCS